MELRAWAKMLVELLAQEVEYFVVSPGSRNTPLSVAIAENRDIRKFVHFDERGAAFHALGYAKATGKPAAIVVTTGTAVGNLLPAVMEAAQAYIPLIVISSDRPPELRDCEANQTIDQVKIFSSFVRWQIDLPCPSDELSQNYLRSTVAQALFRATDSPQGPVHINCMFREPLLSAAKQTLTCTPCHYGKCENSPHEEAVKGWAHLLNGSRKGLILIGSLHPTLSRISLHALTEKLGWPILPDILSGMRNRSDQVIAHYDLILKHIQHLQPDTVLHLGGRLVSKTLQEWLKKFPPQHYLSVSDHPFRQDPHHLVTHRLACNPELLCEKLLPYVHSHINDTWGSAWKELSDNLDLSLTQELNEPEVAFSLGSVPQEWGIFLANSMPIRDADMFVFPHSPLASVFSNRGVSGIDGNIATAVGIAQGMRRPVVALLGDMATLHDLNSFAQLKKAHYPVIFIVVNNGGGGIFSFLPEIPNNPCFEEFFACAHTVSFAKAAELFGIAFHQPANLAEYVSIFHSCIEKQKNCIIEVVTDRWQNATVHQSLYKAHLCSLTQSPVH